MNLSIIQKLWSIVLWRSHNLKMQESGSSKSKHHTAWNYFIGKPSLDNCHLFWNDEGNRTASLLISGQHFSMFWQLPRGQRRFLPVSDAGRHWEIQHWSIYNDYQRHSLWTKNGDLWKLLFSASKLNNQASLYCRQKTLDWQIQTKQSCEPLKFNW